MVLVLALLAAMVTAATQAQGATEDLLRFIPGSWPIVARVDSSDTTTSGAYLKKAGSSEDQQKMDEATRQGLALILRSIGFDVDVTKGVLPWAGQQMVLGVNPDPKAPQVLLILASKDQALAEGSLLNLVGSVIRDHDPAVQDVQGAKIFEWNVGTKDIKPAYAIGDGTVIFAESAATVRGALEASATGKGPSVAALLQAHANDIAAFAADAGGIFTQIMGKEQKQGPEAIPIKAFLSSARAHGGLGVDDNGVVLTIDADSPAAGFLPLAGSTGTDVSSAIPGGVLAMASIASAKPVEFLSDAAKEVSQAAQADRCDRPDLGAAAAFIASCGEAPVAAAATALIPSPCYLVVGKATSAGEADAILKTFQKNLAKAGYSTAADGEMSKVILSAKGRKLSAGYVGISGNTAFYATDLRSAQKAMQVKQGASLAEREGFAQTMALTGGPRAANIWMGLDALSALGFIYDGMGAQHYLESKQIAEALKSTNGLGVSAGFTDKGVELKLAVRTSVGPGTPVAALYGGLAGFYTGMIGAAVVPEMTRARTAARSATSLSNLKQLVLGMVMYAEDWDGKLPDAAKWRSQIKPYVKNEEIFNSPFGGYQYCFNAKLSGVNIHKVLNPSDVVILYEGYNGKPPVAGYYLPADGAARVAYLDGHVKSIYSPLPASALEPKLRAVAPQKASAKKPAAKQPVKKAASKKK